MTFRRASRTAPQLTNTGLGEEGIQLSQRIIGSSPWDAESDPDMLAGHMRELHTRRERLRHRVSAE